jgi:alkylation response protein AidB-like acyl-CoA dehydrogenase
VRLGDDPEVEKFRAELNAFLDEYLPSAEEANEPSTSSAHMPEWTRRWQRTMFDHGWLLPGQPPEYGGRNATLPQVLAHAEELSRRRVYHSFNPQGVGIIAASILSFGTEEQKRKWALPLLRAEITGALGMSEPGAGSDLAGLRTRADLVEGGGEAGGDVFVVNGQKVWTSGAHHADVILTFVRTDPDAPKHRGISVLLIPTGTPGVTRRPFPNMTYPDDIDFNEVFFDNARVPAENLLGELHKGWAVAGGSLGHERTMLWVSFAERLDDLARDSPSDAEWYATLQMDLQALRLLGYQQLAGALNGTGNLAGVSVLKLFGSEAVQRGSLHALEEHGEDSLVHPALTAPPTHMMPDAFIASWFERYARSFPGTIAGGTSEIHRNIIAERILGLPR